ncbi:DUF2254 domain-containing protein [Mycobacterium sp. GA-2829]|uniref:DUF2254 domain-containing protein n=1 Tax=Mycobacterium sp. GA-2829 TaxID=1772283 RepID=UPI00073FCF53|nr:DUF2254 domain-containing protein [Mycobacterium sp. GA-2829]KUI31475.1 hypothetical protein AU194_28565 [Mycobacterium sp. GA-2829]
MPKRPSGGSRLRREAALYRFRESLFALPALIVVAGFASAVALLVIDRMFRSDRWGLPVALQMRPGAAQELLAVLAGATITTAGVVFSLTVVSLQLASQQFSPRVLRTFIADRPAQAVIGLLVATFVYCVVVLWEVRDDDVTAPVLATGAAVVIAVSTVLAIIAFLDHLARGLQVGEVLRRVSEESEVVLAQLTREERREREHPDVDVSTLGRAHEVFAPRDGWVTQASLDELFKAIPEGGILRLETRVGAYISEGQVLARVWPPDEARDLNARIAAAVYVGDVRTMQEDLDFGLRQLVDIGLRALSPAINDPSTAIEVVLRVGSTIRRLLLAGEAPTALSGPGDRVLLRPWDLSFDEYVGHAFDQLRFHGSREPEVAAALVRTLNMLIASAEDADMPARIPPLVAQHDLVLAAVERHEHWLPQERERLRAIADVRTDPAEHR